MSLTKRHFEAVARILRAHADGADYTERHLLAALTIHLADFFASENPNFDRARFYRAASPDEEE